MAKKVKTYGGYAPESGLGTTLDGTETHEELKAKCGLDYLAALAPHVVELPSGDRVRVPNSYVSFNPDTNDVFGTTGDRMTLIQIDEQLEMMDAINQENGSVFTVGGKLFKGAKTFLIAEVPDEIRILETAYTIKKRLMMTNGHDGMSSLMMCFLPTTNNNVTLNVARSGLKDRVNVRHVSTKDKRIQEALRTLGLANNYFNNLNTFLNDLAAKPFDEDKFKKVVEELFPIKEDAIRTTNTENTRAEVMSNYNNNSLIGMYPEFKDTAFGAYLAVADFCDHKKNYNENKNKATGEVKSTQNENRFTAIMDGKTHTFKNEALDLIVAA